MKDIIATKYTAQEGFVWVRKDTPDFILGSVIYLAPNDSIDNYMEIPEPEQEAKEQMLRGIMLYD